MARKFNSQLGTKPNHYGYSIPHVVVGLIKKQRKKRDDLFIDASHKRTALEQDPPHVLRPETEDESDRDDDRTS